MASLFPPSGKPPRGLTRPLALRRLPAPRAPQSARFRHPGIVGIDIQTPARLSLATLNRLPRAVRRPGFDLKALRPGILHLGVGAFHRAHQAVYTQRAIVAEGGSRSAPWGIVGASFITSKAREALRPQQGLYSVIERGADITRAEVVGTLREVIFAPDDPEALLRRFMDPAINIVTLTVTASAYHLDANGRLCAEHPEVLKDLQAAKPSSALGVLVAGLARLRKAGRRAPVVMCCDNLASNGRTLRRAAMDYAALFDDGLSNWIGRSVQFPSSMVDRIVPATTEADLADAAALLGMTDKAPVSTEPFRQWVIEDFDGPRPRWEAVGAEFVPDVAPWEASKLRLLNGTHMAIAYLGALAGFRTVADVVGDEAFAAYALCFMLDEQMPTMPASGHDITAYAHQLLERWRNPGIAHQLSRVGRNGSEKLQTRLLASIGENLRAGRAVPCTTLAVAAWICCSTGRLGQTHAVEMEDPLGGRMRALGVAAGDDAERLTGLVLEQEDVFGQELPRCEAFRAGLASAVRALRERSPHEAIAEAMS